MVYRRHGCKEKANKRKGRLNENRNLVNFRRDIAEVRTLAISSARALFRPQLPRTVEAD